MPWRYVVASIFMVALCNLPAAFAGTCAVPDEPTDCSQDCTVWNACLRCCTRTRTSVAECRAQCAPLFSAGQPRVGRDPQSGVQRPSRPTRPVRIRPGRATPTPAPVIDASRFAATCSAEQVADRVTLRLVVTNGTGAELNTVVTRAPVVQAEAGTKVSMGKVPSPRTYATLAAGTNAVFEWRGRMRLGGTAGFSAAAVALGPSGELVQTRQVDCGTIAGPPPSTPTPTPTPDREPPTDGGSSPGLNSEAAQCANCHEAPHMAFVADMWADSGHASTNGPGRNNTFCANCHSPLQADAHASAGQNTTIPDSQWQGVTCSVCHPSDEEGAGWTTPIGTYDVATRRHSPVPLGDADVLCTRCHTGEFAPGFQGYGDYMNFAGVRCIDCHMPKIPSGDPRIGERVAHNFKVAANLPYSCGTVPGGCHARRPTSWAVRILELGPMHTRGH